MTKNIPFSPYHFMADTVHLSPLAVGLYIRLLCHTYQTRRPLPIDITSLERITGVHTDIERAALSDVTAMFFRQTSRGLVNPRAEAVMRHAAQRSKSARGAAQARWSGQNTGAEAQSLPTHQTSQAAYEAPPYQTIIDYLNSKTKALRAPDAEGLHVTDEDKSIIDAQWKRGMRLKDFKTTIKNMASVWLTDRKMCRYLRPETLFGKNMRSYVNTPEVISPEAQTQALQQATRAKLERQLTKLQASLTACQDSRQRTTLEGNIAVTMMRLGRSNV